MPHFPKTGFASLEAAREWVRDFVDWYNHQHKHRGINYVTPHQRHAGQDVEILAKRHTVYQAARERHPQRWSGDTRNWSPVGNVWLNPEKEKHLKGRLPEHGKGDICLDNHRYLKCASTYSEVVTTGSGTSATFSCEIILEHSGMHSVTAHYTGSARYHSSQSDAVPVEVREILFEDRFESR